VALKRAFCGEEEEEYCRCCCWWYCCCCFCHSTYVTMHR